MISTEVNLSKIQKEIVSIKSGALCVKAVAGSGKTRVLTERIRNLLLDTNKKVLALTFTNKAAEEMRERLSDVPKINERSFIGTFHGFSQFVLENHGNVIGLNPMPQIFEDEGDRLKILETAIKQAPDIYMEYKNRDNKNRREYGARILEFISQVKRELILVEEINKEKEEEEILLFNNYQEILNSLNAIDYDDLLLLTYKLLSGNPNIASLYRRSYPYIFIDEAQDLNNVQYHIILAITAGENSDVMMVGDPNQSIFAFNGSSPKFMEQDFIHDFSPKVIELTENFRSSRQVIIAANKIIPGFIDNENTVIEGKFELYNAIDEIDEAKWVIHKIQELINLKEHRDIEGLITYEKIAVLARNRFLFLKLQELMKDNNIPFWLKSSHDAIKYESNIMKIFDLALRLKINPRDSLHKYQLLKLLKVNTFEFDDLEKLLSLPLLKINERIIISVLNLTADGGNLQKVLIDLQNDVNENVFNIEDNERVQILYDISELLVRWHNYARKTEKKSLQNFKIALALGQIEPLAQPNGVTLSTVHTMKGQEYDIVFIIGLDQETFPDYRSLRGGAIELQQEKNNLYVAFTRAKRFLYASWPRKRLMPWGDYKFRVRSQFLKEFI